MHPLVGTRDGIVDIDGGTRHLAGTVINHVAWGGDRWWAVDDSGGVWHQDEQVAQAEDAVFNCVQPGPDGLWLGADSARLFRLSGTDLTEDGRLATTPGRERWHTPWGGPPDVRSLAYRGGVLYANVHVGGIVRYDESGPHPTIDIAADVHQVVAHPDRPDTVLAATAWGLAVATDGITYDFRRLEHGYCRAVAVRGDTVLVSEARGPSGGDAAIHRGSVDSEGMTRCGDGLPSSFEGNIDTHCLAPTGDGFIAANGTTVWRSKDDGQTWEVAAAGLPPVTCVAT